MPVFVTFYSRGDLVHELRDEPDSQGCARTVCGREVVVEPASRKRRTAWTEDPDRWTQPTCRHCLARRPQ